MARTTGAATDLITFSRASSGTALTKVAYGPELVTNGDFSDGSTGWTLNSSSVVNGQVSFSGGYSSVFQTGLSVTASRVYEISYTVTGVTTSGTLRQRLDGVQGANRTISEPGTYTDLVVAASSPGTIVLETTGTNTFDGTLDNISVKEVFYNSPTGTLKLISHPTNKPRVEYDANGVAKGLLIEEARTNLLTYSIPNEAQAGWTTLRAQTQPSAILAPNGLAEARLLKPTISSSGATWIYSSQYNTGVIASISVFAKASGKRWLTQSDSPGNVKYASFDLENGVIGTVRAGYTASMQDVGNGWYRCSVTTPTGFNERAIFAVSDLDNDFRAAVSGDDGILLWGAQLETGSFPTSYIPTSGATATRSADLASVSVSDFGYNDAQGTMVIDYASDDDVMYVASIHETNQERWLIYRSVNVIGYVSAPTAVATNMGGPSNTSAKVAISIDGSSMQTVLDGGTVQSNSLSRTPAITDAATVDLGHLPPSSFFLNGHIKSINYYPLRLSDAKLQSLTS